MIRGAAIASVLAALAFLADVTRQLGAHPFWSDQVLWVGALIGLVVFVVSWRLGRVPQLVLAAVILAAGATAALYGKSAFAASFAEDALAGRLWYFGWFGVCAGAFAFISATSAAR